MSRVISRQKAYTLDELIAQLQQVAAANKESQGNTYVVNSTDAYLTRVEVVEMELSDGSTVQDVRLSSLEMEPLATRLWHERS
jgi:hypothetical protein